MKLSLPWKSNRTMGLEIVDRRLLDPLHCNACSAARFKFALKIFQRFVGRLEEVAIHAREFAIDLFLPHDVFNAIDCCGVTLRGHARAIFAMQFLQLVISIIQRVDQMGGRSPGHPATDQSIVQHYHTATSACQSVGNRETGNPCADNAGIGFQIFAQRV